MKRTYYELQCFVLIAAICHRTVRYCSPASRELQQLHCFGYLIRHSFCFSVVARQTQTCVVHCLKNNIMNSKHMICHLLVQCKHTVSAVMWHKCEQMVALLIILPVLLVANCTTCTFIVATTTATAAVTVVTFAAASRTKAL